MRERMSAPVLPLIEAANVWPARGALIGLDLGTKTVGVAVSDPGRPGPSGTPGPDELLRRADTAMYAAKQAGKNRVVSWSPSLE